MSFSPSRKLAPFQPLWGGSASSAQSGLGGHVEKKEKKKKSEDKQKSPIRLSLISYRESALFPSDRPVMKNSESIFAITKEWIARLNSPIEMNPRMCSSCKAGENQPIVRSSAPPLII